MKYILLFFVLSVFLQIRSLAQKEIRVILSGKLANKGSYTSIYLDTLTQGGAAEFDKATIDAEGKFEFSTAVEKTNLYKLRLEENNYLMLILSPGEKISFYSPGEKLGVDARIKGSAQTELLYRMINALHYFDVKRDSLNKQYNVAMNSPEHDSLGALIISEFTKNDSLQKIVLKAEFEKMPNSLSWIFFQDKFDMNTDFPLVDRMEKDLYKSYPYIAYVQQFHQQIELERKTAIGAIAPDFTLNDPEGNPRSLSSLRGKVVLLDFWASWCGPCRKENPNVVKAYGRFHERGFEVFSVSLDKDRESWLKAIATDKLTWPNHVSDLKYWKSAGAAAYGVTSIPAAFLIDKEGKIAAKKLRGDALEQKLEEMLK
jgi:peroxiredoxin